jgi:hypothetical protein
MSLIGLNQSANELANQLRNQLPEIKAKTPSKMPETGLGDEKTTRSQSR